MDLGVRQPRSRAAAGDRRRFCRRDRHRAADLSPRPRAAASPSARSAAICIPQARVVRRGKAVRRKCFATDGARLVMPAFGAYTGGLNIRDSRLLRPFRRSEPCTRICSAATACTRSPVAISSEIGKCQCRRDAMPCANATISVSVMRSCREPLRGPLPACMDKLSQAPCAQKPSSSIATEAGRQEQREPGSYGREHGKEKISPALAVRAAQGPSVSPPRNDRMIAP